MHSFVLTHHHTFPFPSFPYHFHCCCLFLEGEILHTIPTLISQVERGVFTCPFSDPWRYSVENSVTTYLPSLPPPTTTDSFPFPTGEVGGSSCTLVGEFRCLPTLHLPYLPSLPPAHLQISLPPFPPTPFLPLCLGLPCRCLRSWVAFPRSLGGGRCLFLNSHIYRPTPLLGILPASNSLPTHCPCLQIPKCPWRQ